MPIASDIGESLIGADGHVTTSGLQVETGVSSEEGVDVAASEVVGRVGAEKGVALTRRDDATCAVSQSGVLATGCQVDHGHSTNASVVGAGGQVASVALADEHVGGTVGSARTNDNRRTSGCDLNAVVERDHLAGVTRHPVLTLGEAQGHLTAAIFNIGLVSEQQVAGTRLEILTSVFPNSSVSATCHVKKSIATDGNVVA